ncbi:hypothetical protein [Bradyrhizobium sp. BR 1432]|uniref:hypothetical protein n=1 Tax=Bradyrhizobium sp. BR 1432 TaxID=3447966 RepID=UPI003EE69662
MKPIAGTIVSEFGGLARSVTTMPPLHRLAGIGVVLLGLTLVTPFAFEAAGDNAFIALTILAGLLTILATSMAEQAPPDRALWLIFGLAIVLRAYVLAFDPLLSNDIYRYVWDGRVQAAGINPYRYFPAHEALASLRDGAILPHINRADSAVTIYPPVAQFFFLVVTRIGESVTTMRLALLGCEAVTVTMIMLAAAAHAPPGDARDRLSLASAAAVGDRQQRPRRRAHGRAGAAGPMGCPDRLRSARGRRDRVIDAGETVCGAGARRDLAAVGP